LNQLQKPLCEGSLNLIVFSVLFQVEITEGELICPESQRKFTIKNGIPNMLLNEDEV